MAFDFKKEYRELYLPKTTPALVTVPPANYIALRGSGDPNQDGGDYQRALSVLYAVAYTLKMSPRAAHNIEGFFDYVVPPLEGFWWQEGGGTVDYSDKSRFRWISVLRLPDFVTRADFDWAVRAATAKKKLDCSSAEFLRIDEGLCAQVLHVGSYDDEPATIALLNRYIEEQGCVPDFSDTRLHHEIYLSDPRRVALSRLRTVIRHPVKKREV